MRLTNFYLPTLREAPAECDTVSAKLMYRAGMIRKLASGIYEWLPLGLRVLKKIENIIREEMDAIGGLEVWLPHLLPSSIWIETGRWYLYGKELFRLKDRKNSDFCLSPTAEEVITDLVRYELRSYKQLPKMFYQFGTKFRDEMRPRFGIIRAREFYMKDAYSFHKDEKDAEEYYEKVFNAYCKIFKRCGLKFIPVEAATGAIGGKFSHEFMVVKEDDENFVGEETIVFCSNCNYAANVEKADCVYEDEKIYPEEQKMLQEVYTPNMKTVEEVARFLAEPQEKFIKTLVYTTDNENFLCVVLIRGDYEVNETKLKDVLGVNEVQLAESELVEKIFGVPVGFLGPVGLRPIDDVYQVKIIADKSVMFIQNAVSGANKIDFHLKNINYPRDYCVDTVADIRKITKEDVCPKCKAKNTLKFSKGIEVGHTFKLGVKYSKSMNATFLDENNQEQYFIMGCYGIGVSRIVAAAIEQNNDDNGIIWYPDIAPFTVYLLPIDYKDAGIRNLTDKIYEMLNKHNIEVLLDDRDERPGVKFKDADLIGIPLRITVSQKLLPDRVELKRRLDNIVEIVDVNQLIKKIEENIVYLKNF